MAIYQSKLLSAIAVRREIGLERFIYALGIRQIGKATARLLALHYGSVETMLAVLDPDADLDAAHQALVEIDQIGAAMANDITAFFGNPDLYQLIVDLVAELTSYRLSALPKTARLAAKQSCSGTLTRMSRAEAKASLLSLLVPKYQALFQQKTDFLVVCRPDQSARQPILALPFLMKMAIRRWLAIHSARQYCFKL